MHKVILSCQSVDEPNVSVKIKNENLYVPHKMVLAFFDCLRIIIKISVCINVLSENSERQAKLLVEHI